MPNDAHTLDLAEMEAAAALARPYVPGSVAAACERTGYPRHGITRRETTAEDAAVIIDWLHRPLRPVVVEGRK